MKKRFLVSIISLLIIVDLIFIMMTMDEAIKNKEQIDHYFWFEKYASKIENEFSGQIMVNQIVGGEMSLRFSPNTSPEDCYLVVEMIHEWRKEEKRLDEIKWIYFIVDGSFWAERRLLFHVGYLQGGLGLYGLEGKNCVFEHLLISPYLNEEFYKLSSYKNVGEPFKVFTEAFIELDDESVFSKITEWQCKGGLYTDEQLAEIEARGIPVIVWGEESAS